RRTGVPDEQLGPMRSALIDAFRAIPGVEDASSSETTPVSQSTWNEEIVVNGFTPKTPDDAVVWFNRASPRYFATMHTRLLRGRDFDAGDGPHGPRVAIVNEAFARKYFHGSAPLGQLIRTRISDTLSAPLTVIGVV